MTSRQRFGLAVVFFAAVGAAGGYYLTAKPALTTDADRAVPSSGTAHSKKKGGAPDCSIKLSRAELEKSVELGTHYMLVHQKPGGNFDYEYNWKTKAFTPEDNAVRQAGALWGISLLNAYRSTPELRAAAVKGIAYFDDASRVTTTGGRYPVYHGDGDASDGSTGGMGLAALVTLGMLDYVRTLPPGAERTKWTARTNEYVAFLAASIKPEGTWWGDYKYEDGEGKGKSSSYSDGEALLALSVAMKYLDRDDLKPIIEKAAKDGHRINVEEALEKSKDSTTTKGYYQWSSMAYYELATSKQLGGPGSPYGGWLMELADWIIDVHQVIDKPRNTGYAYEGIVSAYAWAKHVGDVRAEKYACAINHGLANLMSWQVGHPRASALGAGDDKANGGVQNHATEPPLRIDVVQHQMHGTMLAIEHLFGTADAGAATSGAPRPASSK